MTRELLEANVKNCGIIDNALVEFGLKVLAPVDPSEFNPRDRFNFGAPTSLEIYLVGEWAAISFADAAAHIERIPQDLVRLSAWLEIAAAYDRRVMRLTMLH